MNNSRKSFSIKKRLNSFVFAFRGIIWFFHAEHNAIIHLVASIAVIIFGIWLSISKTEWMMVIFAIGFVFCAEIFNTAIEKLADEMNPDYSESIKRIKDLAAAAVLISAITAAFIGLIIFIPPLLDKIIG